MSIFSIIGRGKKSVASTWTERKINYKSFLKKEEAIHKYTKKAYKHDYPLLKRVLSLHLDSMGYVFDLLYEESKDQFYDVFMRLGVKILHNSEAIRNLINIGLYGSGWATYRALRSDVVMLWYLYFNPDLIKEWSSEKFDTYKDNEWRKKFSEKTIIKNVNENGKKYLLNFDYESNFPFYSKALHPSYFGIRFFQNTNGELAYLPEFSMGVGHLLLGNVISLLPYPTQILLEKSKPNLTKNQRLCELHKRYNKLIRELNEHGKLLCEFHKEYLGARNNKDIAETLK